MFVFVIILFAGVISLPSIAIALPPAAPKSLLVASGKGLLDADHTMLSLAVSTTKSANLSTMLSARTGLVKGVPGGEL